MNFRRAVLAALTYSDHFGFPLTCSELYTRLVRFPISLPDFTRDLKSLYQSKAIAKTGEYYYLPGRSSTVSLRAAHAVASRPLLVRARSLAHRLSAVPGVMAVYLTGSLAMKNTDGHSDIDLMIITPSGRLWLTRLLLTAYCSLFGLRRFPGSFSAEGKLCLNLYLTPAAFLLPRSKQSLYTAYELIQAIPLSDPHHTRAALLAANASWLRLYLPNFRLPAASRRALPTSLGAALLLPLELLAYRLQRLYMRRRLTREYVTADSAFFHPRDPGASVLKKLHL